MLLIVILRRLVQPWPQRLIALESVFEILLNLHITVDDVTKLVANLSTNKADGLDDISASLLKASFPFTTASLAHWYYRCYWYYSQGLEKR